MTEEENLNNSMSETKRFEEFFNTVRSATRGVEDYYAPSVQHVFVVRHGDRTDDDKKWDKPILRPWDPEITPRGLRRAYETGLIIKEQAFIQRVVSSPFLRCLQTADEISKGLGLQKPITVQNGVQELMSTEIKRGWDTARIEQEGLVYTPHERAMRFGGRFVEDQRQPSMVPMDIVEVRDRGGGAYQRFKDNIIDIANHGDRVNTVIVTHGDGVAAAVNLALPDVDVFETGFCGFVHLVRNPSSPSPTWRIVQESGEHGVSWMELLD